MYGLERLTNEVVGTVGIVVAGIALIIALFFLVIVIIARCRLFKKCNRSAWEAIVPFYTDYVFFTKICGLHWAWFAGFLAVTLLSFKESTANLLRAFVYAMAFYNLAIKTNKDKIVSMIFGAFFSGFVTMIYGFSNIYYDENAPVKQSGLF